MAPDIHMMKINHDNVVTTDSKYPINFDVYCNKSLLPEKLAIISCQFTID